MTETKITIYTADTKDWDKLSFFGIRGGNKKKKIFQKCRSTRILPSKGNISEEEDLKIKADKETEKKQCKW